MNPALKQLKDIHLPHAISMWPTAPGWILLYMVAAGLFLYFIYRWYQKRKRNTIVNYALQQLNQLKELMQHNPQNINIAAELSTLIRRTALYYFSRDAIAGLSGQNWLQFLNESSHSTQFTTAAGQLLIDAPYRKNSPAFAKASARQADLTTLFTIIENWLLTLTRVNRKEK